MGRSPDRLRRVLGGLCLVTALGMLVVGLTLLKERLQGEAYIYYWTICMTMTFVTLIIALLDMRAVRLRSRQEQTRLIEEALRAIARERGKDNSGGMDEGGA